MLTKLRKLQMEALDEVYIYSAKLLHALPKLVDKMNDRMEDADSYQLLQQFSEGLNWVIRVTNRSSDYINESRMRINMQQVNNTIEEFNKANLTCDYKGMADIIENGIQIFLEDIRSAAEELA